MEATTISGIGDMLIKWTEELSLGALMEGRVATAINTFVLLSALVAVALIVVAGYMFITSSGDPEKVGKASKALTAAIVGMVIVFAARLIIGFVIDLGEGNQGVCTPGVCKQEGTTLLLCMPDGTWAEVPHCPD